MKKNITKLDQQYPITQFPEPNAFVKPPQQGRGNQRGYKEAVFAKLLQNANLGVSVLEDVHLTIPHFNKPYEPEIVLFDETKNLYIDVEIDEPYDGYFRGPRHFICSENGSKKDDIRDLFFTESGWVVVRFTEKQVHCQPDECVTYIRNLLSAVRKEKFTCETKIVKEKQWDDNQSRFWEQENYREKYLEINKFNKTEPLVEVLVDGDVEEEVEKKIHRTKCFKTEVFDNLIAFNEETHKYLHPLDQTGNAEYISVTTLIDRFFPFDEQRFMERIAAEEGRNLEEVIAEYTKIRDEAAEKGTLIHNQIEYHLKNIPSELNIPEFKQFEDFYEKEIKKRRLQFYDAEKKMRSDKYGVAGTIDCLFKKPDKEEYVMVDWKRSKKLIVDGQPKKYGHGMALSELSHIDNSSYYKYSLQQNIYKIILEEEFGLKLSSMKLVVLYAKYPKYYVINVPNLEKEALVILNSIKYKI